MQPGRLGLYTGVVHCRRRAARIVLAAIVLLVAGGRPLRASSLEMAFLRGLREHGLYDYALFEIDRLKAQPHLSPELAATLDFERAITQLQAAQTG